MTTDLVPLTETYAIAKSEPQVLLEAMAENIGNQGLTAFDLDRVTIPAGGGKSWTVPTLEGEESAKTLEGVIVGWREPRAYWRLSLDESGGNTPPDCSSDDGVVGVGDPGGQCAKCQFAQFGSKEGSDGQACKQMRLLFIVRPSDMLPLALFLPPTSLKACKQYFLRLASQGIPYYGVITKLALESDKNAGGVAYSKAVPTMAGQLAPEDIEKVKAYSQAIKGSLDRVRIEDADAVNN